MLEETYYQKEKKGGEGEDMKWDGALGREGMLFYHGLAHYYTLPVFIHYAL